ncbi:MAG: ferredoxin thioredoxin reductase catalytic beta chain [Clostridia bacterium]|nr:ferredoxin thioredoxin reductase catalytic beta chain [Clostridia bacterium]
MNMRLNEDENKVNEIKAALIANGGFCPSKGADHNPANKCMCAEFKMQIENLNYEGYCRCGLYYKEK